MNKVLGNTLLVSAFLAAVGTGPLGAATCDTRYRIWQDGDNTFYKYGEVIVLTAGEEADLYIHAYPSRSKNPYSASADIGAPADFGVGRHRSRDVSRVLRLGKHEPRKGKVSFTTVAAGSTALGYRITDVVDPGRLEKVPRGCRTGQVRITVRAGTAGTAPETRPLRPSTPPSVTLNDAAHQLIVQLYTGILRRGAAEAADYPDDFFDQVQRDGLQGLISVAETMTSSREFQDAALARTRQSLARSGGSTGLSQRVLENQLLSDIFASLYGSEPYGDVRRRIENTLSTCLSGRGDGGACRRLGSDLLNQRQYHEHNRDLLRHWR